MTLTQLIESLQKLQAQGYGELDVFYRIGSSGDCGPLGSARVTDIVDQDTGPFDLASGQEYVEVYAGN